MKTNTREILIYYNPEIPAHRRTVAHATSISNYVKAYPFSQAGATEMDWKGILGMLNVHPREILDATSEAYHQHIEGKEFDDEGWLSVIRRNPDLIRAPIAIRGRQAVVCDRPTDIYKLTEDARATDVGSSRPS